jgi:ATP-dependent DNA ligase, homolog of eukaryotic ligase III
MRLNMLSICTSHCNITGCTLHIRCVLGFLWFSELPRIIHLSNVNRLVFVMEAEFVLYEVGTEFLNNIYISLVICPLISALKFNNFHT